MDDTQVLPVVEIPPLSGWQPTPDGVWTGRCDGASSAHARWHQRIRPWEPGSIQRGDVAILGFASDEGVRRNHGRPGAAQAPDMIRAALAPIALSSMSPRAWEGLSSSLLLEATAMSSAGLAMPMMMPMSGTERPADARPLDLHDAGTVHLIDDDLETGQEMLGRVIAELLDSHRLTVVLGGGHETAYGTYLGLHGSRRGERARIGVINLDAHFDLRDEDRATSGTPFAQMARRELAAGRDLRYLVLGVSPTSNTRALFETAHQLQTTYLLDTHCTPRHLSHIEHLVDRFVRDVDIVHLSIDVDVLPASIAPGVSAPAAFGVPLETLLEICHRVSESGKLAVVDVVEVSPPYDVDGITCRAAARLVSTLVEALPIS
ncbi:formimidoylglutamase [Austwickia sp. TVS 96-490-7B]|uniref:formimidoylglutamase n=1 Tax=Austwickia sp. TVS 96-490-7B TaxID=2830843 RepID=UPI001C5778DF|nr:formimidoylglutamase [Austwickia sp. TVS 96-490-7B]